MMEEGYIKDPHGQWAREATASSTFGESTNGKAFESYMPVNLVGRPDEKSWAGDKSDVGFDWFQTTYEKPVAATEVRVALTGEAAGEAVNKLELQDNEGQWHTVWSGLSDLKRDRRGLRTWFVRTFPKTPYKVTAVKVTLANAVVPGSKEIDAVQLVGE